MRRLREYAIGPLWIRENYLDQGERMHGHTHNFAHPTFARLGWMICRGRLLNGAEFIRQYASPEYVELRRLWTLYEPERLLRPIRFPDVPDHEGLPFFDIRFIRHGEPVPEGGVEIPFEPVGYGLNIAAEVRHEIFALSPSQTDCTYPHRDHNGNISLEETGNTKAYV